MKKKLLSVLLVGSMVFALAGCGKDKKETPNETTATTATVDEEKNTIYYEIGGKNHADLVDYSEYVELGKYNGLDIKVAKAADVKEEMNKLIEQLKKNNISYKKITDRTVLETDQINLNYKGEIDGKEFDTGSASNVTYKIHGGFIESLDTQLIGLECGKEYKLECKFPEDYGKEEFNGKDVVFTVTVNYICGEEIYPDWTDDFVKIVTQGGYNTTKEFEEELTLEIKSQIETNQHTAYATAIWSAILADSKVTSYPEKQLSDNSADYYDTISAQFKDFAEKNKVEYEAVLGAYGFKTEDELKEYCEEKAKKELDYIMLSVVIAQKENITITDEIYNKFAAELAASSGFDKVEDFEKEFGVNYIMESMIFEAVSEWLCVQNNMVEVEASELETTSAN